MTSISHLYSDFSILTPTLNEAPAPDEIPEPEVNLDAYEEGYDAGWQDAVTAQSDDSKRLTEEFVQQLQDMSFTYHEACSKLTQGLKPLMTRFVTLLLPQVAQQAIAPKLMEQIAELLDQQIENSIEIAVSPDRRDHLREILENRLAVPFSITPEPALSSAQVYLRVNKTEREINFDAVVEGLTAAIDAFYEASKKEINHG